MISDFPHNIRIRLARLTFFCCVLMLLCLCPVGCISLEKLNWVSEQGRDLARSGHNKKKSIWPIVFLYYEERLVWSNLNSKLFRFNCVRPSVHSSLYKSSFFFLHSFPYCSWPWNCCTIQQLQEKHGYFPQCKCKIRLKSSNTYYVFEYVLLLRYS